MVGAGLIAALIASALASAGVGVTSAILNKKAIDSSNQANIDLANQQMDFNAEQSQINRDWQEQMSNTAYQRQITDMQQAGLNPYLAYGLGGSSVPVGGSAYVNSRAGEQQPSSVDLSSISNALNSMSNLMIQKAFIDGKIQVVNSGAKHVSKVPEWLDDYRKNFAKGIVDL